MSLAPTPWAKCGGNLKNTNSSPYPTYTNGVVKWAYGYGLTTETYQNGISIGTNDELYTIDNAIGLKSFLDTGYPRWNNDTPLTLESRNQTPAIDTEGNLYVTYSDDPAIHKYDSNGAREWSIVISTSGNSSGSPTILDDGGIVVIGGEDTVVCFEPDGTERWRYISGNAISGTPAVGDDGTVYISKCGLIAFEPSTGAVKWIFDRAIEAGAVYASPVIGSDGTIYIISYSGLMYAVNPNGSAKWGSPLSMRTPEGNNGCSHNLVIDAADIVYFFDRGGTMNAINTRTRQFVWSRKYTTSDGVSITFKGTPVVDSRNNMFFGSFDGLVFCINRVTGATNWTYRLPKYVTATFGSLCIARDGTVYIPCGTRGYIFAFESFPPVPKTTVRGYVYDIQKSDDDENQFPIAEAQVVVQDKIAYTDETGFYQIELFKETFPPSVPIICRSTDNTCITEIRRHDIIPGDVINQSFYIWPSRMYT